jgi:hypothetical protein
MVPILTAEDVVRRIAAECAFVDERGGVGIRLKPAAAIVRQYAGVWLVVSPWVLDFAGFPTILLMWNSVISGALIFVVPVWALTGEPRHSRFGPRLAR